MRRFAIAALVCLLFRAPAVRASPAVHVWSETSLVKVFPDSPPGGGRSVSLDACRGEWESFQVVVRAEGADLPGVFLAPSALVGPAGAALPMRQIDLYQERYVPVRQPSGNAVSEPREWPDALIPVRLAGPARAARGRNLAFWVTLRVPREAPPGRCQGAVNVRAGGRLLASLPVALRIWDLTLPAANHQSAMVALYYENLRDFLNKHYRRQHPLAEASPGWQRLKERYYRFLLDYRLCPYDLPASPDSELAGRLLKDARVSRFRLPWVGEDPASFNALSARLRAQGRLDRAFYYQYDEPPAGQHAAVKELSARVHAADPSIRRLLTLFPVPELQGAVDIWCPDLGDSFGPGWLDLALLRRRREAGEETWWYTMCTPRAPYPTWLVDDDAVSHRIFFWMQSLYGITGFVYSQVHGWSADPYQVVSSFAGSNGDGLLVYPGQPYGSEDLFPSIRLQALRDGLEDYELLWLLRGRVEAALRARGVRDAGEWAQDAVAAHCRRLVGSLRAFSRRPRDLLAARRNLLEEILRLEKRPLLVVGVKGDEERETGAPGDGRREMGGPGDGRREMGGPGDGRRETGGPGDGRRETGAPVSLALITEPGARLTVAGREIPLDASGRGTYPVGDPAWPVTLVARKDGAESALLRGPFWPAEETPVPPEVICPLLAQAPVLDGRIGDAEWAGAARVSMPQLANGLGPATARTECFLGRDAGRLYFAARCFLPERRPRPEEQSIALILDPAARGEAKLELLMTGTGKRYATWKSRLGHSTPRLDWRWAQSVRDGVWECEMSLGFGGPLPAPEPGGAWGVDFERQSGWESSTWALTFGDARRLGRMGFQQPAEERRTETQRGTAATQATGVPPRRAPRTRRGRSEKRKLACAGELRSGWVAKQ